MYGIVKEIDEEIVKEIDAGIVKANGFWISVRN